MVFVFLECKCKIYSSLDFKMAFLQFLFHILSHKRAREECNVVCGKTIFAFV